MSEHPTVREQLELMEGHLTRDALFDEVAGWIERLQEYVDHKRSCNKRRYGPQMGEVGRVCTCGLEVHRPVGKP